MSAMDLSTTYMGIRLAHPVMPGAGPMADDLDEVRRLEDAGAPAIVMRSLFEEQLEEEQFAAHHALEGRSPSAEAASFLPVPHELALGPEEYLEQLARVVAAVDVPVFGSLNGTAPGTWLEHGFLMQQAGARGIELNVHQLATDPDESAEQIEQRIAYMTSALARSVSIPVAVKLSPFFTSLPSFARRLEEAGAHGLVLFNRFYQPDVDVEALEVAPTLTLSHPSELLLRLRWLAILSGRFGGSLAASGGIHDALGALKAVMCGASATQMVSGILRHGPGAITEVRDGLAAWLEAHEYDSLAQAQGSMSLERCPDPSAFERANYIRIIGSWGR